jgi:hypothetical protein
VSPQNNIPTPPSTIDLPIKDISTTLWVIEDYSLSIFLSIVLFCFILFLIILFYIKKLRKEKKEYILRVNINKLNYIKTEDIKEFSYQSSKILNNILYALTLPNSKNPLIKIPQGLKLDTLINKIQDFIKLSENFKYKQLQDNSFDKEIYSSYKNLLKDLNVYL